MSFSKVISLSFASHELLTISKAYELFWMVEGGKRKEYCTFTFMAEVSFLIFSCSLFLSLISLFARMFNLTALFFFFFFLFNYLSDNGSLRSIFITFKCDEGCAFKNFTIKEASLF